MKSPPRPENAEPVPIENEPELPFEEVPVLNETSPETPLAPAFGVVK